MAVEEEEEEEEEEQEEGEEEEEEKEEEQKEEKEEEQEKQEEEEQEEEQENYNATELQKVEKKGEEKIMHMHVEHLPVESMLGMQVLHTYDSSAAQQLASFQCYQYQPHSQVLVFYNK